MLPADGVVAGAVVMGLDASGGLGGVFIAGGSATGSIGKYKGPICPHPAKAMLILSEKKRE